jgi:hypothetical protein
MPVEMLQDRFKWLLGAVVVAAVAGAVFFWWPNEEAKVRRRLDALAETVSIPPKEQDLARVARAARSRGFFTDDVAVEFEGFGEPLIRGRDAIVGMMARPWGTSHGVHVELSNIRITIDENRTGAEARFDARAVSLEPGANPPTLDGRMVVLTMRKVDGTWMVAHAHLMPSDDSLR